MMGEVQANKNLGDAQPFWVVSVGMAQKSIAAPGAGREKQKSVINDQKDPYDPWVLNWDFQAGVNSDEPPDTK